MGRLCDGCGRYRGLKRLVSNISSEWQEAANRLKPRWAARKIIAYVESYDDVTFWRDVLDEYETDDVKFEVMLPSRTTLVKGKKTALMHNLGPYMIACVDADYDWLMQGRTSVSQILCTSPYVLHTYVYAIENYQCYAPGLHQSVTRATLNDHEILNIQNFMEQYSRIVWPLFVWSVWTYRNGRDREFGISHLIETISFHEINVHNAEQSLEYMRHRVNRRINTLQQQFPQGKRTYKPLMEELQQMGLTPETAYLYIQGHGLMDGVVVPLLNPICVQLRREREHEIEKLAVHETQRQNELSSYKHSSLTIETALKKSTAYKRSQQFQTLRADITRLIGETGTAK